MERGPPSPTPLPTPRTLRPGWASPFPSSLPPCLPSASEHRCLSEAKLSLTPERRRGMGDAAGGAGGGTLPLTSHSTLALVFLG